MYTHIYMCVCVCVCVNRPICICISAWRTKLLPRLSSRGPSRGSAEEIMCYICFRSYVCMYITHMHAHRRFI